MFRAVLASRAGRASFPRVSGDVPQFGPLSAIVCMFSPRERGCSRVMKADKKFPYVFPA